MSDYLYNLAVVAGYAISLLGGSASMAASIGDDGFRPGYLVLGFVLMVNFFAMGFSGVEVRP